MYSVAEIVVTEDGNKILLPVSRHKVQLIARFHAAWLALQGKAVKILRPID